MRQGVDDKRILQELSEDERISLEYKRLRELYTDITGVRLKLVLKLIFRAAFMTVLVSDTYQKKTVPRNIRTGAFGSTGRSPSRDQRRCKKMIMARLQECRRMGKRTRWIDARLMELHCGTERTTGALRKTIPGTDDSIILEEQLEKITGYERHYSAQLIEAMQKIVELDEWLRQLPERHEDIMRLRYIDARSWSEVAREVGYSEAHCYTLHHEAIALLEIIEQKSANCDLCLKAEPLHTA